MFPKLMTMGGCFALYIVNILLYVSQQLYNYIHLTKILLRDVFFTVQVHYTCDELPAGAEGYAVPHHADEGEQLVRPKMLTEAVQHTVLSMPCIGHTITPRPNNIFFFFSIIHGTVPRQYI